MRLRLPNMVVTTFLAMLAIVAIAVLGQDDGTVGRGEVGLELGAPAHHPMVVRNGIIALPVVLRLVNRSDAVVSLTPYAPCRALRFIITTRKDNFVQASGVPPDLCPQPLMAHALGAGEAFEEIVQIALDAERYVAGDYVLRARFWGYEARGDFRLVAP